MLNYKGYVGACGAWGYDGTSVTYLEYRVARIDLNGKGVDVVP